MAEIKSKEIRLSERLRQNKFKLNALLEMTKAINNNSSVNELIDIYEGIVKDELGISKLILFIKNEQWNTLLQYGLEIDYSEIDPEELFQRQKELSLIESDEKDSVGGFDVLLPVYHKDNPLAFLMIGDENENEIAISPIIKHLNFIQTLTNIVAVAVENKRLAKETVQQERLKRELELAAELQNMLVPSKLPSNEKIDVAAKYFPHQEVGGDYYDFIPLGDKGFLMCMADVSGKGVAAAILMSNFQATLKTLANNDYRLEQLVEMLNTSVYNSAKGERFITFFLVRYIYGSKRFEYVNAGHNPAILISQGTSRELKTGTVGLGMLDQLPFLEVGEADLLKHDILVTYTDGLVEIENVQEEEFGTDRLASIVMHNSKLGMNALNDEIIKNFDDFRGSVAPFDDTTLLACRFLSVGE
ncbi:MAG: PP2C family protein-serine/threonine phosphatase [Bacteroidota bacterium]